MEPTDKSKNKIFTFKNDRILSSIIIIVLLVFFLVSIMMNIRAIFTPVLAVLSALGVYEMIHVVGAKSKLLYGISTAVSLFSVFAVSYKIPLPSFGVLASLYVVILLAICVFDNKNIKYTDAVMAIFSSLFIPYAFSCFIRLNDIADVIEGYRHYEGIFLVGLCFVCSWLTDTFAYIVGSKLGKHKMCPVISPKKSIEGAVGGLLIAGAFAPLLLFIFQLIGQHFWSYSIFGESAMKYLYVVPLTIALSGVSMVGDLAASVLKRNFGIKDYSNLIKGHGGIMDRFDSCVFVVPTLYALITLFC